MRKSFTARLRSKKKWQWLFWVLPVLLLAVQWSTDVVEDNQLLRTVPELSKLPWLETSFAYLYLHLFTFIPVFLLSFDKNVHYYRKWRYLLPAILPVAIVFILWDVYFTVKGVWGFNESYLLGLRILQLPLEEWLFFFTVPFACVFIYECLNYYIRRDWLAPLEPVLTPLLIVVFLLTGAFHWSQMYTATTFLLAGFFLLHHYIYVPGGYRSRFYLAYLVSWIPFLLVNGILTGSYTQEPIVLYNPEEYLGIRVTSIPLDDSVYSFLLLFGTVTLYEFFQKK